ncbi:15672_t:CDS:2, partial [Racocetra persica]
MSNILVGTKNESNVQCIITPRTNPTSNILAPRINPTSNVLVGTKNESNVTNPSSSKFILPELELGSTGLLR